MRNPNRIPQILQEIQKIWEKYPDFRLGQLISNAFRDGGDNFYFIEDDHFLNQIKTFYGGFEHHD